jgi:DNA-binding MarR family transcriptional regulator
MSASAINATDPKFPSAQRFDSLEQQAFLSLWRTYDRLRLHEDALFGQFNVTPQQYNALRLLRAAHPDGLRTLRLAERLVSRAPDITRLLDKLDERGLVQRDRPDGNRRVVVVRITANGLALLDVMAESIRACHVTQLGHLPAGDLRQLVKLLAKARRPHEEPGSTWLDL